jgi:hypothetical protein
VRLATISKVAGYYLWPPVWVGSRPSTPIIPETVKLLGEEAFRTKLAAGISVKVLRGGMFLFDFTDWPPGRALPEDSKPSFDEQAEVLLHRVTVLNAHLACLYTALAHLQRFSLDKMALSPGDLIGSRSLDEEGISFGDLRTTWLVLAQFPSTYAAGLPIEFDLRMSSRTLVIEIATLEESFQLLDSILQHQAPHALLIAELHMRSCKAYEDHNYNLCLITAWAIIERLLQTLWTRYVDDYREKQIDGAAVTLINADRKSKLTESRDFTASVVSEILSLTERLPFSLYRDLSTIRKARNDWIHDLIPVSREAAGLAIQTSEGMLSLVEGLNLKVPLVSRISA